MKDLPYTINYTIVAREKVVEPGLQDPRAMQHPDGRVFLFVSGIYDRPLKSHNALQ